MSRIEHRYYRSYVTGLLAISIHNYVRSGELLSVTTLCDDYYDEYPYH